MARNHRSARRNRWSASSEYALAFAAALTALCTPSQGTERAKRAIVVVQHALLVAIWHMLSRGALHEDLCRRWRSSSPPPELYSQPRRCTEPR